MDGLQPVATRRERRLHLVSARGRFKTRHTLTPEKLELRGVPVVVVVKKSNHDKTEQDNKDNKDKRQSALGSVCSSNATTDFSVACSVSKPPVNASVASFIYSLRLISS